jgi:DNA-binding transcriptional MerR regulator
MKGQDMLRIGELAKRVGITTHAIRYYERIGLLGATPRSPSGYRLYSTEAEAFLRFLKKAQGFGFTLQEVKTIWEIRATGKRPCGYVSEQVQKKIDELEQKIRELQDLRQMLVDMQNERQALEPLQNASQCICPIIERAERR